MITSHTIAEMREQLAQWRLAGEKIAFVPTMGDLHDGHLSLVREAKQHAERVVVSIFVNPLQFGENEDFDAYPRVLEKDSEKLIAEGVDLLFAPTVSEMYPAGQQGVTQVVVPEITDTLCGASRPGHFTGVATVVSKLFNMVQPDIALFGQKDYQQLLVIQKFTRDLCFPIEIIGVPTRREDDGLAMSSRNGYLSAQERAIAPTIYQQMTQARDKLQRGEGEITTVCQQANQALEKAGFTPDYFEVRRAADLGQATEADNSLIILVAARLGKARLIDNLTFHRG